MGQFFKGLRTRVALRKNQKRKKEKKREQGTVREFKMGRERPASLKRRGSTVFARRREAKNRGGGQQEGDTGTGRDATLDE